MKKLNRNFIFLLILSAGIFVISIKAQDNHDPPIKVAVFPARLPVIANENQERFISGSRKEKFTKIKNIDFSAVEEAPVNIAILIDTSGNTFTFIKNIIEAGQDFINGLRLQDKAMVATFDEKLTILTDLIPDKEKLSSALNRTDVSGGKAANMPDAMYHLVTREFAFTTGKKVIILLSDGNVKSRTVKNEKLLNKLIETGTQVYPIIIKTAKPDLQNPALPDGVKPANAAIKGSEEESKRLTDEHQKQIEFITTLGITTGGKVYFNGTRDFKKPFLSIAEELKKQD